MGIEQRRIGRYVLDEPVGRGAMGCVYRAEDPEIHRVVAVKVLSVGHGVTPEQLDIARERFRREARAAGSIDHPNIVRIFDAGEDAESGEMYIVMEFLSGCTLEEVIQQDGLDLEHAIEVIGQIAAGLDAAHAHGIIHRDVKPSNVLFAQGGMAKIADFGITHFQSSGLTQDMAALGTPAYTSPEQVAGRPLDARADLFSLGVLSYEVLTGMKPFTGVDAVSIAYAVTHTQPVPISAANPALPQGLDPVFERMLSKAPADRFESAGEFFQALRQSLAETSVPPSTPLRTGSERTRFLAWAGALGVLALAVALGVATLSGTDRPAASAPAPGSSAPVAPVAKKLPAAMAPKRAAAPKPAPRPLSTTPVTFSLVHRMKRGTLTVLVDGKPIFAEAFTKTRLAISQTTEWDPVRVAVGKCELRARVSADGGRSYLSEPFPLELAKATPAEVRFKLRDDKLIIEQR